MIKLNMSSLLDECKKLCEERQYEDILFDLDINLNLIRIKRIFNKEGRITSAITIINSDGEYYTYDGEYTLEDYCERTNVRYDNSKFYKSIARIICDATEKACFKYGLILRKKDNTNGEEET